jgi:MinD superfamily P-loop ATPase
MPDFWQHHLPPVLFPNKALRRSSSTQGLAMQEEENAALPGCCRLCVISQHFTVSTQAAALNQRLCHSCNECVCFLNPIQETFSIPINMIIYIHKHTQTMVYK